LTKKYSIKNLFQKTVNYIIPQKNATKNEKKSLSEKKIEKLKYILP
jgi:hypothetical protein